MDKQDIDNIREAIRHIIETRDLKKYKLAKRAGISYGALNNFMNGSNMTIPTLQKLATELGYKVSYLINYRGK